MKNLILLLLLTSIALADTPPPGALELRGATDGILIGNTGNALNVNITGGGGSSTVNQGTPASSSNAWPVYLPNPISGQHVTVDNFPSPVPTQNVNVTNFPSAQTVNGTVNVGNFPSPVPTQAVNVTNFPSNQNVTVTNTPSVTVTNPSTNYSLESGGHLADIDSTLNALNTKITNPMPVTVGNFPGSQTVNGNVGIVGTVPISGNVGVTGTVVVSGTVTSNIGTTGGLALNSTLTSLSNKLPATLGQTTSATSLAVVIASDQSAIPVTGTFTATNASIGLNGSTAPTSSTEVGGVDNSGNLEHLNLTAAGALKTDSSATTQPISGSVSVSNLPANQPVTVTNVSLPVTGAFFQSIQPVSQSGAWNVGRTWSLSSGTDSVNVGNFPSTYAVTQSTSPWVVSGGVTANIGTTGGLALDTSIKALQVLQGSTTSGQSGTLVQGSVTTSAPTYVTGQTSPFSLTTSGALRVNGSGVTQPVSQVGAPWSQNLTEIGGSSLSLGQTTMSGSIPVTLASNQSTIIVGQGGTWTNTVTQSTGSNLHVDVDNFPASQTVNGTIAATQSGTWNLNNISGTITLPTGAATASNQVTQSSTLTSILGNQTNGTQETQVTNFPSIQPVSQSGSWTTRITDGTNTAVIKPASTAPTVTDPSLVVAISPNSPISVTSNPPTDINVVGNITTACPSGSSCAVGSTIQAPTSGYATLGFETHGTWSGTLTQDVSFDMNCTISPGTVLWYQTAAFTTETNESIYLTAWGNTFNQDPWQMSVAGVQCARLRAIALASGTVNVTMDVGIAPAVVWSITTGNAGSGSDDVGNPVKVGGVYNSSLPTFTTGQRADLQLDVNGRLITRPLTSSDVVTVTQGTSPWVSNVSQFGGVNVVTGVGASGSGIPRVTVSNDSNILSTQSGSWTVQPGNTANTTPWLFTIQQGGNAAQVTGSNALKVDNSAVTQPISGTVTVINPSTAVASLTSINNSASTFSILALNGSRKGLIFYNNSTTSCNIAFAATASTSAFTFVLTTHSTFTMTPPIYQGPISGICNSATGTINSTEF